MVGSESVFFRGSVSVSFLKAGSGYGFYSKVLLVGGELVLRILWFLRLSPVGVQGDPHPTVLRRRKLSLINEVILINEQ